MDLLISEKFQNIKKSLREARYQVHQNDLFNELCILHNYLLQTKDPDTKNELVEVLHDIFIEIFMPLREPIYKPYPSGLRSYFGSNILLHQTINAIFDLNAYSKIWLKDISEFYTLFSIDLPHYNAAPKTDFSQTTQPINIHKLKNPGIIRSQILDHLRIHIDPDKPLKPQNNNLEDLYIYEFELALYEEAKVKNRFFQNMKYKEFSELQQEHTALLHLQCISISQEEMYDEQDETLSWLLTLTPHNDHLYKYPLFKENPCLYLFTYPENTIIETFNPLKANYLGKKIHINEEQNTITLRISKALRDPALLFALVLRPDTLTYDRERKALHYFKEKASTELKQAIIHKQTIPNQENTSPLAPFYSPDLNQTQRQAVQLAIHTSPLFCIQGPPGTGKTKVCVEILLQYITHHPFARILVTSASQEAVDNILSVFKKTLPPQLHSLILRIGEDKKSAHSLNHKIKHSQHYQEKISSLEQSLLTLQHNIETLRESRSAKEIRRGQLHLQEQQINDAFAHARATAQDLDAKEHLEKELQALIHELIDLRYALQDLEKKSWEIKENLNHNREELKHNCITQKPLFIFSTNNYSDVLRQFKVQFDLVLMDEVTQSTEPSLLIPLTQTTKLIMAGDHHQLPPTVFLKNKNYDEEIDPLEERHRIHSYQILSKSLFERLYNTIPSIFLDLQYRMNPLLIDFLNTTIYKNTPITYNNFVTQYQYSNSLFNSPLTFITHTHPEEQSYVSEEFSPSKAEYHNLEEIAIIAKLIQKYLQCGINAQDIGVITPYTAQVRELNKVLEPLNILAKTIDHFQGQEKKIIILSLVRSNQAKSATSRLGFLVDERRFNVAITRFQYELIIVGNQETLSSYEEYYDMYDEKIKPIYYKQLIEFIKARGVFIDKLDPYLHKHATFDTPAISEKASEINIALQKELIEKVERKVKI